MTTAHTADAYFVHPTASVEAQASIGAGTKVWHQAHIRAGARVGRDCVIGKNVFVDAAAVIGDRCKIQNNVSVYSGVTLADAVFVGPGAAFTNDLRPRSSNTDWRITETTVDAGASIGANATLVCGVHVGRSAMVAAGAVVTRSVQPHQLVRGNPARPAGWVCWCGEVVSRATEQPADLRCAQHTESATTEAPIPISVVRLGQDVERSVLEVLRSGQLAQGRTVRALEEEFAAAHDVAHAVAVNNGTSALVAAIRALGIGPGDEVITSPFSFVATLNAVLESGATCRFADIGPDFCIDPAAAAALITPRTRALLPVHLYGLPADMDALMPLARQHGLAVVEDAAQAHGARVNGRAVGSFGVGCFSFYATKNVMCGEGGMITTNDDVLADRLRVLRNQGMRARYQYEMPGHNYRLTEVQAAIALPQVRALGEITAARRRNADRLTAGLSDLPGVLLPHVPEGREHVFHQYTIRLIATGRTRDEIAARLADRGIGTGCYYPALMHDYDCYRSHPQVVVDPTPRAQEACAQVLSLPVHPHLSAADCDRIVTAVREALR